MLIDNILFAAAASAALMTPMSLVMIYTVWMNKIAAKYWISSKGNVANLYRNEDGEIDADIFDVNYVHDGKDYTVEYKYYGRSGFVNGSSIDIHINPNGPLEIKILTRGENGGYLLFFIFAYVMFFVVILIDEIRKSPSS